MSRFSFDGSSRVLRIAAFIKQVALQNELRDRANIDLLVPYASESMEALCGMGSLYIQFVDGNNEIARYEIRERGQYRYDHLHLMTFDVEHGQNNNEAIESLLCKFNACYGNTYRAEYAMALEGIKGLTNPANRFLTKLGVTGKTKCYNLFSGNNYTLTIDGSFNPNGVRITLDRPQLCYQWARKSPAQAVAECRNFMIEKETEQLFSHVFNLGF